jgi:hypothetical protein
MGGVGGYFGDFWRKFAESDQIEIVLSLAVKPKKQLQLQD